ncbi:MAG: DUF3037 domain-containing protein [Bacteroidales bacterium]|nr:DUF3037 domain-containing protein [Bacteroidales bacterium]
MKTYYTIIKVIPNSLVKDSISVGMVLSDDISFQIRFSENKVRIAKSLLGDNRKHLDFIIQQIEKTLLSVNDEHDTGIFNFENKINASYFNYLNRYSNNIVQYERPSYIKEDNTTTTFNNLFRLFIDNEIKSEDTLVKADLELKNREIINAKLISRVKDKVHTNIKFSDKILPTLYFNYELDCIGLNGVFTGAKSINFNVSEVTLQKEISNYYAIASILENNYNKYGSNNNFYLISDEPSSIGSKEHQLWEKLRNGKKFNLIHTEEADLVAQKIEATGAAKFLQFD